MMMAETTVRHTPGPWKSEYCHTGGNAGHYMITGTGEFACDEVAHTPDNRERDRLNAEHVVRVVNCHADLLKACRQMVIEAGRDGSLRDVEGYVGLVEAYVLPAIAKAEGK